MSNILMEVGIKYAITRWREKFGTQPDIESPEFKAFQKEVNRDYNQKYASKQSNDDNVGVFAKKLLEIQKQNPQKFPQEFYNALTNLQKKGKAELCNLLLQSGQMSGETSQWLQVISNLYSSNKAEAAEMTISALLESNKYPWINDIINKKLIKEDDFNLDDFDASVVSQGVDMGTDASPADNNTNTQPSDDTSTQDDFDLDNLDVPDDSDLHIAPAGGNLDLSSMPSANDEEGLNPGFVDPNAPTYRVIDVLFDDNNPDAMPKVKVKNMDTGEVELKDIFEIDV